MSLSLSQIVLPAYQQTLPAVINILEKGAHFAEHAETPMTLWV